MRVAGTVLLGILFFVSMAVFFLLRSVTSFPLATDAVVGVLREGDVRRAALDAMEDAVRKEVEGNPDAEFAEYALAGARGAIEEAITDEWFYGTIEKGHRGLVEFVEKGDDSTRIDLRDTKKHLRTLLREAGREAAGLCAEEGDCPSEVAEVRDAIREYDAQIEAAIAQIPDDTNLTWLLSKGEVDVDQLRKSSDLAEMREGLELLATLRWAGLAGLLVLLGLVALVNKRTLQRAMVNVGLVAAISAGLYLVLSSTVASAVKDSVIENLETERAAAEARGETGYLHVAAGRVTAAVVDRVFGGGTVPVVTFLVAGVALFGGGLALHIVRRRRGRVIHASSGRSMLRPDAGPAG